MINNWLTFAEKIIKGLIQLDNENGTEYTYFLTDTDGKASDEAVQALASVMAKVDKMSQWEPIQKQKERLQ